LIDRADLSVLDYVLEQKEKVVVFAYHQNPIETQYAVRLRQAGRKVITLTGDTKDTHKLVNQLQTYPDVQFFILSMNVGGQGITLTAALQVVFVEQDWSPALIDECHDGCHRIGQTRPMMVKYFVLNNSLDRIMMQAVRRKVDVSRHALNKQKEVG
jgi:SWI/SNF-related matrix-associated actin-dependent regulator of chromatin subfamily A-like protein 1